VSRDRTIDQYVGLRCLIVALIGLAIASAVFADLMVTNSAGVRAGIAGIVYRPTSNSIGVKFAVQAPATNTVTTFVIQRSPDLTNWTNISATLVVTGSLSSAEIGDPATPAPQYYRIRLINF
jgi:hypothetical protein